LDGKVAFVTGGARGQGRAEAVRFAQEGADVVVVDSCRDARTTTYAGASPEDLKETARLVEAEGKRALTFVVDVVDLDALKGAMNEAATTLGGIDVVVANAGICTAAPFWEITSEQWNETIQVNLTGTFHTLQAAALLMIEQGTGGSIIATSSVAGLRGLPFVGAYVASKHGIVGLARTLANEVAEYGIRVNSIHPGPVSTGMSPTEFPPLIAEKQSTLGPIFMNAMPTPLAMDPADVAATVAWLASDDARYVTGTQIPIDLGTMLR